MTQAPKRAYYIGIMSGTSIDAVDAVLASFGPQVRPEFAAAVTVDLPAALQDELLALNHSGPDELIRAADAAQALAQIYAQAVHQLLEQNAHSRADIAAIGAHGQTVRHLPERGISLQLNAPALLAELTGIDVIADFRSRDLAAGGQGAPLVPAFHELLFSQSHPCTVLNVGGMANVTVLPAAGAVGLTGFDTGPGNVLMDYWCQQHLQQPYDDGGQWAATGQTDPVLLAQLMAEPWLQQPPPKSTGRDLFNAQWLAQQLQAAGRALAPRDVQATLLALSVQSISQAITRWAPDTREVIVCGGGAYNSHLLGCLNRTLQLPVKSSQDFGIAPQYIEAYAFAWLAYAYTQKICAGRPEVTGANKKTLLGARYYA